MSAAGEVVDVSVQPTSWARCVQYSGQVAQSVEQRTENPCVGGSIPPLATNFSMRYLLGGTGEFYKTVGCFYKISNRRLRPA